MLTMKNVSFQKCMYVLGIVLLASLFAACSDPSSASGATPTPTIAATATSAATPTQPVTPTPTSAATLTQPATPTPATGTGKELQPFTGVDFAMLYPAKWQKTKKTGPGGMSGEKNQPASNTYGFIAPDNITGFHIVRRGDEQAVGGMVNTLIGGEFKCEPGDKSVPSQVTVAGVTWSQADLICLVASNNYEVRELVTSSSQYGQTVIMYGAYQQVGNGAVVPDFAHTKATYFDPMLASFKFN
jgi:hypothetical protein